MSSFNLRQRISTPEIQLCLRYVNWNIHVEKGKEDKKKRLLYSGGSDSIIHIYELVEFKEIGFMPSWNPYFSQPSDKSGHQGPVLDIIPIQEQKIIISCAFDGSICIWDRPMHTWRKTLKGHKKSVYSLT